MTTAIFNENHLAIQAGTITVYNFDGGSREYLGSTVEYIAVGVGIPANSALDEPLAAKPAFAVRRNTALDGWEYAPDYRGSDVYEKTTGVKRTLTQLGDYPDDVTPLAPATPYDVWNGSAWVTDEAAQQAAQIAQAEQTKTRLLNNAKNTISLWQTELQLGIISDDDKAQLIAWMRYIQALQKVDTKTAPDIAWPEQPQ
ncbi:tail fiber assembly protein [Kosakonia cowanii]|uniref:tail fiber assembly protein n=1 Tax=Kosakonia cowanii TaxID=208223 RepID=UPI0025AA0DE7|nr:tail fiber assembly protein [Kosakonia cowanii]MDM9616728.1 tail fiber assembly protein [Kosakonia cowanii]MDP4561631.1 tail fiber assembly protein [Kosakonia cowanii]